MSSNPTRIDLDIYLMGDIKFEFISFWSDCFTDNFIETLSWGNFRRFQWLIEQNNLWITIYFIVVNNEQNSDWIINTFKMYEKRNFMLMWYNKHETKSEKSVNTLCELFLSERDKLYDGILNKDVIEKNVKRIRDANPNIAINEESLQTNLNFLTDREENLIYKIGFGPNWVNKKTKILKHSNTSKSNWYDLRQDIFSVNGEDVNFQFWWNYLWGEHNRILNLGLETIDIKWLNEGNKTVNHGDDELFVNVTNAINWWVALFISISLYKILY